MLTPMGDTANTSGATAADQVLGDLAGLNFEDALKALEDIVRRLESGDAPLEESIDLYARGDALRGHCQARLDAAQARIEAIVAGPDGKPTGLRPFDDGPMTGHRPVDNGAD